MGTDKGNNEASATEDKLRLESPPRTHWVDVGGLQQWLFFTAGSVIASAVIVLFWTKDLRAVVFAAGFTSVWLGGFGGFFYITALAVLNGVPSQFAELARRAAFGAGVAHIVLAATIFQVLRMSGTRDTGGWLAVILIPVVQPALLATTFHLGILRRQIAEHDADDVDVWDGVS